MSMIKRFFFSILFIIFIIAMTIPSWATTYYVDSSITDTNPASATPDFTTYNPTTFSTSTGTDSVYKTIADVNLKSFSGGDSVLFRKGQTWRERLTVPSSGSAGNIIIFGAYGTGVNPIISGANLYTSWTLEVVDGEDFTDGTGLLPEAWYLFENNANDSSANSNNLTNTAGTFVTSPVIQGTYSNYYLDDNSAFATIADASLSANHPLKNGVTSDFTIGGWVRIPEALEGAEVFIEKLASGTNHFAIRRDATSGTQKIQGKYTSGGVAEAGLLSNNPISINTWYHVVVRWQGSTDDEISMFIDGVKQTATFNPTSIDRNTSALNFAKSYVPSYMSVYFDEWFFFNSSLTDAQILDIATFGLDGTRGTFTSYYTSVSTQVNGVWEDNSRMAIAASKLVLTMKSWWWDNPNDRLYVRTSGDNNPAGYIIEGGQRYYAVLFENKSYVTVQDIVGEKDNSGSAGNFTFGVGTTNTNIMLNRATARYGTADGISFQGTGSDIIVSNSTIHDNGSGSGTGNGAGINFDTFTGASSGHEIHINNNEIYNNQPRHGINTYTGDYIWIYENDVHDNGVNTFYGSGINIVTSNNIKVYQNEVYNHKGGTEDGNGISVDLGCDTVEIYYNLTYGNDAAGISILGSPNVSVYNNTSYNNGQNSAGTLTFKGEIRVSNQGAAEASNLILKNNLVYATTVNTYAIRIAEGSETNTGLEITNNDWYSVATNWWFYGNDGAGSNLSIWNEKAKVGTDLNSNPLFMGAAYNDFRLQRSSPAINAGTDVGLHQDYVGHNVPQGLFPDIGAYEERIPVWRRWW